MDRDEVLRLMSDLESHRVERTVSLTNTDKFAQAICAFANDLPHERKAGYLFVGVRDDGKPSGAEITDQLLQNLGAIRSDGNIQPLPAMTVHRLATPGGDVAVVEVLPSDLPPVRYKGQDRIELLNPGGLFGDLTPEQFPRGTSYRNPILAEAARTLGFVNRYGRGIAIAQAELKRNDSPPAAFEPGANHFLAAIPKRP